MPRKAPVHREMNNLVKIMKKMGMNDEERQIITSQVKQILRSLFEGEQTVDEMVKEYYEEKKQKAA